MLTLEQCRQILGTGVPSADADLTALRDQLYALADIAVTTFLEQRVQGRPPAFSLEAGSVNETPQQKEGELLVTGESQSQEIHQ
jgi:hypothetical protein